jgi:hypothetical protein
MQRSAPVEIPLLVPPPPALSSAAAREGSTGDSGSILAAGCTFCVAALIEAVLYRVASSTYRILTQATVRNATVFLLNITADVRIANCFNETVFFVPHSMSTISIRCRTPWTSGRSMQMLANDRSSSPLKALVGVARMMFL